MAEDQDGPDEGTTRRVQSEGISMIHRMQRVTDRLEREAENLLDNPHNPQQRRMGEFRTLGSASENVMAAQRFYDQLESNNGEEVLTFAANPPNQNFIGSGTKFIRQTMESSSTVSNNGEAALTFAASPPNQNFIGGGTQFIRQTMESTNPSSSVSKMCPVSSGGKRTLSPYCFPPNSEVGGLVTFAPGFQRGE